MKEAYDFLGGRKIFFALLLTLIMTLGWFFDYSNADQWMDFEKWVFGIYAVGNGTEHISNAVKSKKARVVKPKTSDEQTTG